MNYKIALMFFLFAPGIAVPAQEAGVDLGASSTYVGMSDTFKNGGCSLEKTVFEEKPAVRVDFNCGNMEWMGIGFQGAKLTRETDKILVEVEVYVPKNNRANLLYVRLEDRDEETWQFSEPLPDKPGWTTLKYEIDTTGEKLHSWGPEGKVNHKIEWPVSVGSMGICFKVPRSGVGYLGFGKIKLSTEEVARP